MGEVEDITINFERCSNPIVIKEEKTGDWDESNPVNKQNISIFPEDEVIRIISENGDVTIIKEEPSPLEDIQNFVPHATDIFTKEEIIFEDDIEFEFSETNGIEVDDQIGNSEEITKVIDPIPKPSSNDKTANQLKKIKNVGFKTHKRTYQKNGVVTKNRRTGSSSKDQSQKLKKPNSTNKRSQKYFKIENPFADETVREKFLKPYECAICNIRYKYKKNLKDHIIGHLNKFDHCHVCSICKRVFDTRIKLNAHLFTCQQNSLYRCIKIMSWDKSKKPVSDNSEGICIYW